MSYNLISQQAYRAKNKERISAREKAYRDAHQEERAVRRRINCRTPYGKFCILKGNAKARKLALELTFGQWQKVVAGGKCCYCAGNLPEAGSGVDRKNSNLGYTEENCVPCCARCNRIRGKDDISHSEMIEVANLLKRLRGKS
jgi:hypothetical protein